MKLIIRIDSAGARVTNLPHVATEYDRIATAWLTAITGEQRFIVRMYPSYNFYPQLKAKYYIKSTLLA